MMAAGPACNGSTKGSTCGGVRVKSTPGVAIFINH